MKILDLLIDIVRNLMYESIDEYGLDNKITISLSQRLDLLIIKKYIGV